MVFTLLTLLIGLSSSQGLPRSSRQVGRCPDGYVIHGGSCYKFCHVAFPWPEAYTFCKAFGAHLVTIESDNEKTFLKARATELTASQHVNLGYWTAGSDMLNENEWIWAGQNIPISIFDWGPGEPDPVQGRDCMALDKSYGYKYGAWDCTEKHNPICEIELVKEEVSVIG